MVQPPHQCCQRQSSPQDVDCLRVLLDDEAPDEADGAEQDHNEAGEVLRMLLTSKVLEEQGAQSFIHSYSKKSIPTSCT